jgi:LysR family glycine cleavage system transcriptional activator
MKTNAPVRRTPPLNSLKAFEATARLGSFVLAAAELHVSPSAVSQQIRKLEDFLGKQLFIRRNNQLMLTDVGMLVQATSTEMMDQLASMTLRLTDSRIRPNLVISALPSVGIRWFSRRLPEFLRSNPDVRVDFRLEDDPVDFYRNRIDVRISFGEHLYPDFVTVPFHRDGVTLMGTPEVLKSKGVQLNTLESLQETDLIHVLWRSGIGLSAYPTWESWLAAAGAPRHVRRELGHSVDMSCLAVDLARSGCGIALCQKMLAEHELAQGILVAPFAASLSLQYFYCAVYTPANSRNVMVQSFIAWLSSLFSNQITTR